MLSKLVGHLCPSDPRESRGQATRARLLEAAILLFGEKGFKAVSVREIADQAQTNVAAISYHFGDKAGLYREAFNAPVQQMLAMHAQLDQAEPAFEAFVRGLYRGFLEPLARDGQRARAVMKMHQRELVEPSGELESFLRNTAGPMHKAVLARVQREIDPAAHARGARPDMAMQRLTFILFGLGTDFCTHSAYVQALAPDLMTGPQALDEWIETLVRSACAVVQAEKNLRRPANRKS